MATKRFIHPDTGKVAVLISPNLGAGWSTANSDFKEFALFDPGLVQLVLDNRTIRAAEGYVISQGLDEDIFHLTGWFSLEIEWLEPGIQFTVQVYDGHETLRLISDISITA